MRKAIAIATFAFLIPSLLLLAGCKGKESPTGTTKYYCAMHPTYVSDKPGDCPICNMRLVPMEGGASGATPATPGETPKPEGSPAHEGSDGGKRVLYYRNPMNPSVTSASPAKDEMGMDYVPVYAEEAAAASGGIEGYAPVTVSQNGIKLAGIQTAPATREPLGRTIRTVGEVVADETRIHHVHTKIPGWIDKLYVNYTGQAVKEGEPILAIYSPELLSTQEEYLRTRQAAAKFSGSGLAEVRTGGDELLRAAHRRLELFDVPRSFIAEIERTGKAQRTVKLTAPATGFVTAKEAFQGEQIETGTELYTITDLTKVWVNAAFYEFEARSLTVGQEARLSLSYDPGVELLGRISYIYPYLSSDSRTVRARLDVDNASLALKPSMYVNVAVEVDRGDGIVVPDNAIMDTGDRQVVFVAAGEGRFVPREVKVGVRSAGKAQVLAGVREGERVVTHANFLLDSESRLRASIASASASEKAH